MKPNFVLNLGHDGIALLHRGKTGWRPVGSVALDDPNLTAGLAMLRKTAVSLEAGGMAVKVLIPDSQILYTEIDIPDTPGVDPTAEIGQRLDGLTPYAPADLAFDWRRSGTGRVRLALVARDTLTEAEAFAREHRFNPVAFAAAPTPDRFPGEPFFGPAASASALLAETGPVEPESEALDMVSLLASGVTDLGELAAGNASATVEGTDHPATSAPGADGPDTPGSETAGPDATGPERSSTPPVTPDRPAAASAPGTGVAPAASPDTGAVLNQGAGPAGPALSDFAPASHRSADTAPDPVPPSVSPPPLGPVPPLAPVSPRTPVLSQAKVLNLRPASPSDGGGRGAAGAGTGGSPGGGPVAAPPDMPHSLPADETLAEAIGAEASGEYRRIPTFASRRSPALGSPRARIEPGLTAPGPRGDLVATRLPRSELVEPPRLNTPPPEASASPTQPANSDGAASAIAAASARPDPTDKFQADAPPPVIGPAAAADRTEGAHPAAAPQETAAPQDPSMTADPASAPMATTAAPGTSAADPAATLPLPPPSPPLRPTAFGPVEPTVLRRLPPIPPRLKPLANGPTRRAPVINFGPKHAAGTAVSDAAIDADRRPGTGADAEPLADGSEPPRTEDGLSVFGARKSAPLQPAARRGSPALVVVMTLLLLAGLAGLALWSTFWPDDPPGTKVALVAPPVPATPAPAAPALGGAQADSHPVLPAPDLPRADLADPGAILPDAAGPDAAMPDLAAIDPVLPGDPAGAADLAGRPLAPVAAPPAADDAERAALPGDDNAGPSPLPGALDPTIAETVAPDTEVALDQPLVDDEALADGEPEALLDVAPDDGGAAPTDTADLPDVAADPAAPEMAALAEPTPGPEAPALPDDPMTELVPTDDGAAARVAAQLLDELTPEVAERRYAASGIWVLPPEPPPEPGLDSVDDLYVAAIDTQIEGEDAVALPLPQRDAGLLPQLPPPPPGTRFDFDERGLVRATPEGAVNPDGIVIYQGRPAVVPAPRPGAAEAAAQAAAPPATPDAPAAESAAPAVPRVRPRPRPDDLTELNEKATLGGHTRIELAGLHPRQRPAVIEKLALATLVPDAAAVDAVAAAADAAVAKVALELAPGTKLAVQSSRLPKARPGKIVTLAAAAVAAPKPVSPAPEPKSGGTVDEADNEPVLAAAVMPKLPTKAGVAKSATVANAINLSKINLIGVYGSSASRRALVRLANGKYVKVQIGDRLDGGKVAAIGEAELIYVKSGRQHKLQMPSKT